MYTINYDKVSGIPSSIQFGNTSIPINVNNSAFQEFLLWNEQQPIPLDYQTGIGVYVPTAEEAETAGYKADLKAQVIAAITRLQGIQNAGTIPFTQAGFTQVVNAVKDMALYEEKIIKVLVRII
jgi:hypothetical protein